MAPYSQTDHTEETFNLLINAVICRWTAEELYQVEAKHPGRIVSLLPLIGLGVGDFLYASTTMMKSDPEQWLGYARDVASALASFRTSCVEIDPDTTRKEQINSATMTLESTVRQMMHHVRVQQQRQRFAAKFAHNEQAIRDYVTTEPGEKVNFRTIYRLFGYDVASLDRGYYAQEFDLVLNWMRLEEIISDEVYSQGSMIRFDEDFMKQPEPQTADNS